MIALLTPHLKQRHLRAGSNESEELEMKAMKNLEGVLYNLNGCKVKLSPEHAGDVLPAHDGFYLVEHENLDSWTYCNGVFCWWSEASGWIRPAGWPSPREGEPPFMRLNPKTGVLNLPYPSGEEWRLEKVVSYFIRLAEAGSRKNIVPIRWCGISGK